MDHQLNQRLLGPCLRFFCSGLLTLSMGAQAGFQVSGTQLLDDNDNPFVFRGINHPHAWYASRTEQALADIASVGANAVRVVLSDGQQWSRTSAAEVAQIIQQAKANQLIAVLEVHDATGWPEQSTAGTLSNVVDYWLDIAHVLEGEEDYVIINIANEPFGNEVPASTWVDEHSDAIARLRSAGLKHTLMVDAANWGQDWEGIMLDNASSVAAADPLNNTLFSVHMYEVYQSRSRVENYVADFLDTHGLPLVVGEFGADHGGQPVDAESILAVAEQYDIGYMGWSWSGNSSEVAALDITRDFNVNNLTPWGEFLIHSANGIQATSKTASVYDSGPGPSSSSSSQSSAASSSSSSSDSSAPGDGQQCNWYGTLYPLCEQTESGWGWEDNESCIAPSTCSSQPPPWGIVGDDTASASSAPGSSSSSSEDSSVSSITSSSSSAPTGESHCEYRVTNEWQDGYTGAVIIRNESGSAINGWSVNWEYSDGSQVNNAWNAQLSGNNPYTASDMGWNSRIPAGESVEFGFQVSKGGVDAEQPLVTGAVCE